MGSRDGRPARQPHIIAKIARFTPFLCIALTLFLAVPPMIRASFRQGLSYNEGWNIYNAIQLSQHQPLYPAHFSWTTNNYPMLSFALLSALHRLTGDYLFTGRAVAQLSTILLCCVVWRLLKEFGAGRRASLLGALFCFSLFAVDAASDDAGGAYTNADDPQMLGLVLVLTGLLVYLYSKRGSLLSTRGRVLSTRRRAAILLCASALLIAAGLSVKHSSIDLVVVLLIDSLCISFRRTLFFLAWLTSFLAASICLHLHVGGPWFLRQLLEPRLYDPTKGFIALWWIVVTACVPLLCAFAYAVMGCRTPRRRLVLIAVAVTTVVDLYFGAAQGVTINCFFSLLVFLSLALGLFFSRLETAPNLHLPPNPARNLIPLIPLVCFVFLLIPAALNDGIDPVFVYRESLLAQRDLTAETQFLAAHPGPALCEDLLTCYLADKPYLYDPFNTTRLIRLGALPEADLVRSIERHQYAAIELSTKEISLAARHAPSERFTQATLEAIEQSYKPAYRSTQTLIYLPL